MEWCNLILAITNSNEKLIRELCAKNNYDEIEVYTGIKKSTRLCYKRIAKSWQF